MNIQELKTARDALEEELLHLIDAKVDAFKHDTGVMVDSVSVDFRRVSVMGGETASFVNGVKIGVIL